MTAAADGSMQFVFLAYILQEMRMNSQRCSAVYYTLHGGFGCVWRGFMT